MGRVEVFVIKNFVKYIIIDGFVNGMGYILVLIVIVVVCEFLVFGIFFGMSIFGFDNWINWNVMVLVFGGFFVLILLVWLVCILIKKYEEV